MNVRLQILFESPSKEDTAALRSVARELTNDRKSMRVVAAEDARGWLVAEFTMPTEAQYRAVDKIDHSLRMSLENRLGSKISFPKSAEERQRARRKAERRRAARRQGRPAKPASGELRMPDAERNVGRCV